MKPKHQ
ncbi:hypothetical protein FQN60_007318 [Etheostoma spectabile]|nr:hypothetical protein FQN60_007318 [Etheostoma spectabile]